MAISSGEYGSVRAIKRKKPQYRNGVAAAVFPEKRSQLLLLYYPTIISQDGGGFQYASIKRVRVTFVDTKWHGRDTGHNYTLVIHRFDAHPN